MKSQHEVKIGTINIYGSNVEGWTLEVMAIGGWYRIGVFGTRKAAIKRASSI